MFAAAVVPDCFGMRVSQDEAHMRAGERSTERVINALSADPSDLHLLILSPPDRGSTGACCLAGQRNRIRANTYGGQATG
jgi:hypothetical protein